VLAGVPRAQRPRLMGADHRGRPLSLMTVKDLYSERI
jgi:hypothetical protein